MVKKTYIPNQGDIIYANFMEEFGHEQWGRRPALVLSNIIYNKITEMAIVAPITSKDKNFPFHVKIYEHKIKGVAMCEQVRAIDCAKREIEFVEKVNSRTLFEVKSIIENFIE